MFSLGLLIIFRILIASLTNINLVFVIFTGIDYNFVKRPNADIWPDKPISAQIKV